MTNVKKRLLATAMYTLTNINDGATGPIGPPGQDGEDKEYYDYSFMDGIKYWSTKYNEYAKPGSNVKVIGHNDSKFGNNVLEIQNDTCMYSKNKMPIQEERIYRFTFRVRQVQDPLNGADKNKVYAGATLFGANGDKICQNNGSYFIASSQPITVANGWKEFTAYVSTKARPAIVNGSNKTLCPAIKAFEVANVKTIKPMFLVNYNAGNGVAQVDGLKVEDYTQEWNALNELKDKLDSDSQSVFDALTDGGRIQGIYMKDGQLYINGQYINAKNLRVLDKSGALTLGIDENGNVSIQATSLKIGSKPVASQDDINNIKIGARNLTPNTGFFDGLSNWIVYNSSTNITLIDGRYSEKTRAVQVKLANINGSGIGTPKALAQGNTVYTVSFWMKLSKAGRAGALIKFLDSAGTESNPVSAQYKNISANTWTYFSQTFTSPIDTYKIYATPRIEAAMGTDVTFAITEFKLEEGTKATTWSPAPEDIEDGKVSIGDSIADINSSEGQILYPKLNISGMISFTDFDEQLARHYDIKKDAEGNVIETLINGGTISTGSVTADQMTMYNLSVVRRRKVDGVWQDIDTSFNINDEGHIRASGTFSSFNFNNETKDIGWQIDENGDSVFNNTLIRGRVELPSAGMTDYGGKGRNNLLKNTNFRKLKDSWSFNGDSITIDKINKLEEAYSVKIHRTGLTTDSWRGCYQKFINTAVKKDIQYYVSGYYFIQDKSTLSSDFAVEIKGKKKGDTSDTAIGSISFNNSNCVEGKWTYFKFKVTTRYEYEYLLLFSWVKRNGTVWFSKFKVEEIKDNEVEDATAWTPHIDETGETVRIWSGETYENRYDAPFQVLQNGTLISTRGEFGGTFTGRVEIGNIKIYDTNTTPGVIEIKNKDDVHTVVRIGEDSSYFGSPLFLGVPDAKTGQPITSFKFTPNDKKLELLNSAYIDVGSTTNNKLVLANSTTGSYLKLGTKVKVDGEASTMTIKGIASSDKVTLKIGSTASTPDGDLYINGHTQTESIAVGPVRILKNSDSTGVDFYID